MPLIIGNSYTLKIAICDAFDNILDSFVFINSQTVNSAFDCPLISANIGDPCGLDGEIALITPDCSCTTVPQVSDIVLNAELDNDIYTAGDTLQLAVNTSNFSTSMYPDHEINIYLSLNEEFNPVTSTLLESFSAAALGALDTLELNFPIADYSFPVSPQPYYLTVDIAPADGEINIDNNRATLSFSFNDNNYITVSLESAYEEMNLQIGQTSFDFSFNMYNPGPNYLTESPVNIYWSEDSVYSETDLLIAEYDGPDMNVNENMTVNLTLDVPQPVVQNPYYVLVVPQPIVRSNGLFDYAVSKIQFNPLSTTNIDKTDWKAFFDENETLVIKQGDDLNGFYSVSLFDQLGRNILKKDFHQTQVR